MKITYHGHSTFALEFGSNKVLVDPFFKGNAAFNEENFEEVIKGTTHIALTHGHYDHLGDTIEIVEKTGAHVIANFDICVWLASKGVSNVDRGNTGGTILQNGFSITFVHARHSSCYLDEDGISHAMGNANGLVFHIEDEKSVYFMGDTDIFGDMALIQELHQPQIGIVPIGDRATMGPAIAALSCRRYFKFEYIFPCHYASHELLEKDASNFIAALEEDSSKVKAPKSGDTTTL
ncbi:MAG: metal-dependent hydrolase [Hyphomicrobiales bacterium]|nr:metal-dependent hydrolase [Hyphomicrobiales bacterium]PCH49658.1 MAG: metal-dependent hydrolase [Hyphomicrobiales bacterium]